jgi:hypothetical protein
VDDGLLIKHSEVELEPPEPSTAYRVIQPEQIPLLTYPYEWCFGQLRDAALATLQIQKRSLEHGMSLKDSSAYNIQFRGLSPVLIDTLSFERYRTGQPWSAYGQFCQHFLAPLALMAYRDVRLNRLGSVYVDGVPLDMASALLPFRTRLRFGLLSHIHLHAQSQKRFAATKVELSGRTMSQLSLMGLIDSLERTVRGLEWQPRGTEWVDYEGEGSYSDTALQSKKEQVAGFLGRVSPAVVWDLGANTGYYSRMASHMGIPTVSADADPACVEIGYRTAIDVGATNILPMVLDLTNPSPAIGWANDERISLLDRGPADAVLALALLHHIAIANNVPLGKIAAFFSQICRWLIIEFVPKHDPQVQRLLASREDIFPDYNPDAFKLAFGQYFTLQDSAEIRDSDRILYLMQRSSDCR